MFSGQYDMPVLASALSLAGSRMGNLTPDSFMILGKKFGLAQQKNINGSSQFQGYWQKNTVGGGKYLAFQDTGSSAGNDRGNTLPSSFYVSWFEREDPIAVDNEVLDDNKGQDKALSLVETVTQDAVSRQLDAFGTDFYTGSPSDYTAEKWDAPVGLNAWITNDNNICGVDRSVTANANFRGQFEDGTLNLSLSLIDTICTEGTTDTTALMNKGSKADIVIVPNAGYNKLKQEAISRQLGRMVSADNLPKGGMVGYLNEYINYNGKMIFCDPKAAASSMYVLDSSTWTLQFQGGKNFKVSPWVNLRDLQPGTGQPDITTAAVCTKARLICHEPWKNWRGEAVS
jgi:hypothetical protein